MDTSKIQDEIAVTKSTDIPTHEQKRLKERAGSVGHGEESFWDTSKAPDERDWAGGRVTKRNFKGGKYPGTDKPAKHWRKRSFKWQDKTKGQNDEREY